ncbi:MAG: hypothetical protein LBM23_09800 [Propionibacteriaceae bacterium]|jgi:hypothetical protein|nr:hypothetical protein [Propionibacteriaceae bacterium]
MTYWNFPPHGEIIMEAGFPAQHWVLQLIAEFAILQNSIEMTIRKKLALETPKIAKVINKHFLSRMTDNDRWELIKALACDANYSFPLQSESTAFAECKRVRDLFAHRHHIDLVCEPNSSEYFYLLNGADAKDIPSPLTPAKIRQLGANCRWLSAFVLYLASNSGVRFTPMHLTRDSGGSYYLPEIEILKPPPLPIPPDWEPTDLTREIGDSGIPVTQDYK